MKRLLLMPVLALTLLVGGCAGGSILTGGSSLTASITTPVGRRELAAVESTYGIALAAAVNYRRLCVRREIPRSCRNVVLTLQSYGARAHGSIIAARNFVRRNPTISAVSAIGAARAAVADFQSVAAANGVR